MQTNVLLEVITQGPVTLVGLIFSLVTGSWRSCCLFCPCVNVRLWNCSLGRVCLSTWLLSFLVAMCLLHLTFVCFCVPCDILSVCQLPWLFCVWVLSGNPNKYLVNSTSELQKYEILNNYFTLLANFVMKKKKNTLNTLGWKWKVQ